MEEQRKIPQGAKYLDSILPSNVYFLTKDGLPIDNLSKEEYDEYGQPVYQTDGGKKLKEITIDEGGNWDVISKALPERSGNINSIFKQWDVFIFMNQSIYFRIWVLNSRLHLFMKELDIRTPLVITLWP